MHLKQLSFKLKEDEIHALFKLIGAEMTCTSGCGEKDVPAGNELAYSGYTIAHNTPSSTNMIKDDSILLEISERGIWCK